MAWSACSLNPKIRTKNKLNSFDNKSQIENPFKNERKLVTIAHPRPEQLELKTDIRVPEIPEIQELNPTTVPISMNADAIVFIMWPKICRGKVEGPLLGEAIRLPLGISLAFRRLCSMRLGLPSMARARRVKASSWDWAGKASSMGASSRNRKLQIPPTTTSKIPESSPPAAGTQSALS